MCQRRPAALRPASSPAAGSEALLWTFRLHNQARFQPIDESRVETYAEAMKRADKFPPVISHGKIGKLIQVDGNHRLQAAIRVKKPLDTYIINAPAQTVVALTFEANVRHGWGTSEDERVQQALYLMENGASVKSAASALAISEKLVNAASIRRNTDRRFLECSISTPQNTGYAVDGAASFCSPAGCGAITAELVPRVLEEYTSATALAYANDLRAWMRDCGLTGLCPIHTSRHDVQRWVRQLQDDGLSAATVCRRLSALSRLLRAAAEAGVLAGDPLQHVRRPRRHPIPHRAGLTQAEVYGLLVAAHCHSDRAFALVALQALNGLRVSEALSVQVSDVTTSLGHRVIHLVGKGRKPAVVPLSDLAVTAVEAAAAGRVHGPLIVTRTGRAMDRRAAARLLDRLGSESGLSPERVHCHALRAGFVTHALQAGVPLHVVQDGARHADPRQTRAYDRACTSLGAHATFAVAAAVTTEPSTRSSSRSTSAGSNKSGSRVLMAKMAKLSASISAGL
jgi:integrase/recombinase XerD